MQKLLKVSVFGHLPFGTAFFGVSSAVISHIEIQVRLAPEFITILHSAIKGVTHYRLFTSVYIVNIRFMSISCF